ncbi:MAG: hypothetical protein SOR57_00980, partial [Parabacteroides sp.]|nr:hypothetical protein [Parabacteroides sp.]
MKKIFTLFILLLMLPVTVLAADEPATLYVGETDITTGGYWKTTDNGKLEPGSESAYNVHYDGNGTLTLNNATIQGRGNSSNMQPEDYGIYAAPTGNQSVSLTINLIGSNTVSGIDGIRIEAKPSGNATLVIQSDRNDPTGNLKVIASAWNGIKVSADNGSVSLTINNASVEASTESQSYVGVSLASLIASAPILSLTVNGGSLTAQGKSGIRYFSGGGTNPSTSLTVSGSALIKAIPDISASVASVPTPKADSESGGIVFDGKNGTMYGDVTLQENLEIGKDETLTIPEGATLNTGDKLTNNGKIINYGTIKGTVTGTVATPLTVEMITVADATYTGVPVTPDVTVEKDGVTYTDYTVSYSNNIKAGTAIVTVTPEESSLLLGDAVTKEFTIAKATPEITLNVPLGEALVYDGKAKEVTATVKGVENETEDLTASVAYYSDDTYQTNVEEAMNAGTYYVKASFAETTNYMAMEETAS